ncbi:MAG: amino acid ABC transporter permease [Lachnospiraceae bacterium]|nr:amino acid ABC transporter permease [Lachnospiraceae bacterium]MDE6713792.1 amino acid ABC transporter permease [Lachnospiraceae bacterium]
MYDISNWLNSYINEDFIRVTVQLWKGFGVTLSLFFLTLILAIPLGLVLAFCTKSSFPLLKFPFRALVYVIRGTPLLLQLMIVIYIPGIAFHSPITKWGMFGGNVARAYFFGALFAFVINYACYFSEIFRGGIENIPKGQYEACDVLGMTRSEAFFKVILLQVIRNILAPMSNEIITLVKDTALARTVAVTEILFCAYEFLKVDAIIWPLFYTGLFYLVFNAVLTWLFGIAEKKLSRYYK